jgi:hypothetical protein
MHDAAGTLEVGAAGGVVAETGATDALFVLLVAALAFAAASELPTTPVPLLMDKVVVSGASPCRALLLAPRSLLCCTARL